MAIQPIDLQALFTQLDKVGKNQTVMREGLHIHESIQQVQSQQKAEENVRSVNEAQDMGEEAGNVKDGAGGGAFTGQGGAKGREENESPRDEKKTLIRDPALGQNIDISG